MRAFVFLPVVLVGLGCQGLNRLCLPGCDGAVTPAIVGDSVVQDGGANAATGPCEGGPAAPACEVSESCVSPPTCAAPKVEVKGPREVHVKVPRQKIVVNAAAKPAAAAIATAAVAQEVLLVPRTVYVPFVAQTPVAAMRVSSLQASSQVLQVAPQGLAAAQGLPAAQQCQSAAAQTSKEVEELNQRLQRLEGLLNQLSQTQPAAAAAASSSCPPGATLPQPAKVTGQPISGSPMPSTPNPSPAATPARRN